MWLGHGNSITAFVYQLGLVTELLGSRTELLDQQQLPGYDSITH